MVQCKTFEDFMKSCVQLYLDLAPGLELDRVPTPFLDEDQRESPARCASHKGPLEECPWCHHTFPPSPYLDLWAYEHHRKAQRANKTTSGAVVVDALVAADGSSTASGAAAT